MSFDVEIKKLSTKNKKIYKLLTSSYNDVNFDQFYFLNYKKILKLNVDIKVQSFDELYSKLSKYYKNVFDKIIKSNETYNKNICIKSFNIKIKSNQLFLKKLTLYFSTYNTTEIINMYDFVHFIQDTNCVPFWNDDILNVSNELFLPSNENLILQNNPKTFKSKTWFDFVEYKSINNSEKKIEINKNRKYLKNMVKATKVKIYFDQIQREAIKILIGYYRYYYNRAIQYINNYDKKTKKTYFYVDVKNTESKIVVNLKAMLES
jgi:hypothetical protein